MDDRDGWWEREGQGDLCWQRNMMMILCYEELQFVGSKENNVQFYI